jgi:hypothetical protein
MDQRHYSRDDEFWVDDIHRGKWWENLFNNY